MKEMGPGKDGGQHAHQDCCEHRMEATQRAESLLASILDSRFTSLRMEGAVGERNVVISSVPELRRSFDVGQMV